MELTDSHEFVAPAVDNDASLIKLANKRERNFVDGGNIISPWSIGRLFVSNDNYMEIFKSLIYRLSLKGVK